MTVRLFAIQGQPRDTLVPVPFKGLYFPGGEPYVELPYDDLKGQNVLVDARVGNMDDFGMLLAVLQALVEIPSSVFLLIPYFPGARADRVGYGDGTALGAQMYADIINDFRSDRVFILDPHSDVTPAMVQRCEVITIADIIATVSEVFPKYDAIICPDQGAEKRTSTAAKALGIDRIVHARKNRNMQTGQLSGFEVDDFRDLLGNRPAGDEHLASFLIVDDICDGGGTFVGISDLIHDQAATFDGGTTGRGVAVDLWVTHGIFSNGPMALKALTDGPGLRHVFHTDSFPSYTYQRRLLDETATQHVHRSTDRYDYRRPGNDTNTFEYPATADDFSPGFTTIPVLPTITQLILDRI